MFRLLGFSALGALLLASAALAAGDPWANAADQACAKAKQRANVIKQEAQPKTAAEAQRRLHEVEAVEASLLAELTAIRLPRSAAATRFVLSVRRDLQELDAAVHASSRASFVRLYGIWAGDRRTTTAAQAAGALVCANG
jgi:hypothetical protein